jgi:hypothetical protein
LNRQLCGSTGAAIARLPPPRPAPHIIDALSTLSDAKINDTVGVFLADHGLNDGSNYRFVSTDAAGSSSNVVPFTHVLAAMGRIAEGRAHFNRTMALYEPAQHRPLVTRFGHDVAVGTLSEGEADRRSRHGNHQLGP